LGSGSPSSVVEQAVFVPSRSQGTSLRRRFCTRPCSQVGTHALIARPTAWESKLMPSAVKYTPAPLQRVCTHASTQRPRLKRLARPSGLRDPCYRINHAPPESANHYPGASKSGRSPTAEAKGSEIVMVNMEVTVCFVGSALPMCRSPITHMKGRVASRADWLGCHTPRCLARGPGRRIVLS
jgi:hypothetical protein